jgi:DNA polymerase III epsilon subunit family exonuclease
MEVSKNLPLHGLTFAVVDVETTGLSSRLGDKICEVAVVLGHGGQIVGQLQTLVNPGRPISRGASAVNGITNMMVHDAPPFHSVAPALKEMLEGTVLVAHNASFDLSFISAEMRSAGYDPPSNPVIDTLGLARRCYTFRSNKLGDVARSLGIRVHGLHRALADATITWHVLNKFLVKLREDGVQTLNDVIRTQGVLTSLSGWHTAPPIMEWDGRQPFCPIEGVPPLIEQAMRAQTSLRIWYKGNDGQQSVRVVQPRKVTLREQATYLVAYCHLKHEERTFRLDRIVEMLVEA